MSSCWVEGTAGSGYPLAGLPYGVFSTDADDTPRVGVAIGPKVADLAALAGAGLLDDAVGPGASEVFGAAALNPFMALGRPVWQATRRRLTELLSDEAHRAAVEPALVDRDGVILHLPFAVADYVDFYSSEHHATNVGKMFRPDAPPLLPNWKHLPVGYHGRAGTIVVSGTSVRRPAGQRKAGDGVVYGPSTRLDIELEVGFVVGSPSRLGEPVAGDAVADHVFGVTLVNDWSARDIQAWEYVPLGPFLGKSFATSISAWVLPLEALEPFRRPGPPQDPEPLPYLKAGDWALELDLEVWIRPSGQLEATKVSGTGFAQMYWTVAQQLAHMTVNGASLRTGDFFASGTVSGPTKPERGSLLELTWSWSEPIDFGGGVTRTALENGDEVILRGFAGAGDDRIALGEVRGTIVP